MNRLHILVIVAILVSTTTVVFAQSENEIPVSVESCPERSTFFDKGVLVYQCEIVDRGGQFIVRETARDGSVAERPASAVEISLYTAITAERDCFIRRDIARQMLATPEANRDIVALSNRIIVIEDAIRECVK